MAQGRDVKQLLLQVDASVALAQRNLNALAASVDRDTGRMNRSLSSVDGATSRLSRGMVGLRNAAGALGLGLGISVGVLGAVAKRALDAASAIGEVSRQLGVTTTDLQVYRYAATQVGISQQEMEKGLQKLTRSLGEAGDETSREAEAFKDLGIEIRNASGRIKTAGEIMPEIADAIARIPDEATRAAVLVRLFGRAGQQFLPLFEDGAKGIEEFTQRAHELGLVLSEESIAQADATADKMAELNAQLSANIAGIVADNADAILSLATSIANVTASIVRFFSSNPERAIGLLSALAGGAIGARVGGLPGAAVGAIGGYLAGSNAGRSDFTDAQARQQMALERRNLALRSVGAPVPGTPEFARQGGVDNPRFQAALRNPTVLRFQRQYQQARTQTQAAAAVSNAPVIPDVNLPDLDVDMADRGSGGGGSSSAANRASREARRNDHNHARELRRFQIEELRNQERRTTDIAARTQLQREILALETQQYLEDLDLRDDLTAARRQELVVARARADADELANIEDEEARDINRQMRDLAEAEYDLARTQLEGEVSASRTAAERRDAELRLLELTLRHERAKLAEVIIAEGADSVAAQTQRARVAALEAGASNERKAIVRDTQGPLEDLLDRIPRSAAEMNEAFQSVAAEGLGSLNEGLVDAIMGARSLGDVFKAVSRQIIADLLRIAVQKSIIEPLANLAFTALGSGFGGAGVGTGKAVGGPVYPGMAYPVGERGIELFQPKVPGTIIPAHRLGMGGGTSITVNVDAKDAVLTDTVKAWVIQGIAQAAPGIVDAGATKALGMARRRGLP